VFDIYMPSVKRKRSLSFPWWL